MNEFRVKRVCPICQHDLRRFRYCGRDSAILACHGSKIFTCVERELFDDLEDNIGLRQWEEVKVVYSYGRED